MFKPLKAAKCTGLHFIATKDLNRAEISRGVAGYTSSQKLSMSIHECFFMPAGFLYLAGQEMMRHFINSSPIL